MSKKNIINSGHIFNHKVWNAMLSHKKMMLNLQMFFDINRLNNANFMLGSASTEKDLIKLKYLIRKCLLGYN